MSTFRDIQQFLNGMRRPVQGELIANLGEPQRRLMRAVKGRVAQLEEFEADYAELQEFAQLHSIRHYGRFA